MNLARFLIIGSVGGQSSSTDRGYDATAGETLEFRLEDGPSGRVRSVRFEVYSADSPKSPRASTGAPELVLSGATTGQSVYAASPGAGVTTTVPVGAHSWVVRCVVDGGVNAQGLPDPNLVFERIVAVRSPSGLRKIISGERTEYHPDGWAQAQNEMVDSEALGVERTNEGGAQYRDAIVPQYDAAVPSPLAPEEESDPFYIPLPPERACLVSLLVTATDSSGTRYLHRANCYVTTSETDRVTHDITSLESRVDDAEASTDEFLELKVDDVATNILDEPVLTLLVENKLADRALNVALTARIESFVYPETPSAP